MGEPVGAYQAMRTVQALERLAFRPLSAPELAAALRIHQRTARPLLRRLHTEDDLAAELDRVRARGHATDTGEHPEDVRAIAAPVFLADEAIAALAVTLTADDPATLDHDALAAHTTSAAAALTRLPSHHP